MSTPRTYGERCAAARALDLVGERWALLVVRELLLGPMRFTDLRQGMPNAKPSVLSQRLRELEEGGVIQRRTLGPPARTTVYELTTVGRQLERVVIELGRWGRLLPAAPDAVHTTDSFVLALKWRFDASRADDLDGTYELRLGDDRYAIEIAQHQIYLSRGEPSATDAVFELDAAAFEAIIFNGQAPREAEREGRLVLAGDRALARRFLQHYRMASQSPVAA